MTHGLDTRAHLGTLAALAALAAACATDPRAPQALASRPLVPAPETGELLAGGGVTFATGGVEPAFVGDYEVGLIDGLALHGPAILAWGGPLDEAWSLAVVGGLTAAGVGEVVYLLEVPADPRRPVPAVYASGLAFGGGARLQWQPAAGWRLRAGGTASAYFYGVDHVSLMTNASASVTRSFSRWVSVTADIGHRARGTPSVAGEVYAQRLGAQGVITLHFEGYDVAVAVESRLAPALGPPSLVAIWTYVF